MFDTVMRTIKMYYIDAYNVMHKIPSLSTVMKNNIDIARRNIIEQIAMWTPKASKSVIVFDGASDTVLSQTKQRKIVFSKSISADQYIRHELEKLGSTRTVCVVSSDHEVRNHAKAIGAQIVSAEEFITQIQPREKNIDEDHKEQHVSKKEVEMWMKIFKHSA